MRALAAAILDTVLPPRCLLCHAHVAVQGTLCGECFGKVTFIADPLCARCGIPLEVAMGEGALCGGCIRESPSYAQARSACLYEEAGRALVTRLKYGDATHFADLGGRWMARSGAEMLRVSDCLVPVPIHPVRLWRRRFNQSLLLARRISALSGVPVVADGLLRIRRTPPQAELTRRQRLSNVRGAFAPNPRRSLADKRITLVDDVLTTGATVAACVSALHEAGAQEVNVLTLARTL